MIVLPRGGLVFRTADNTQSLSEVLYLNKILKQLISDQGSSKSRRIFFDVQQTTLKIWIGALIKLPTRIGSMMHSLILFTGLLFGTIVLAVPIEGDGEVHSSHFLNVIDWGQNGGNAFEWSIHVLCTRSWHRPHSVSFSLWVWRWEYVSIGYNWSVVLDTTERRVFSVRGSGCCNQEMANEWTQSISLAWWCNKEHILSRHRRRLKRLTSSSGAHMEIRKVMLYIDPLEQLSSMAGTWISRHLAVLNITNISSIICNLISTPFIQIGTISLGHHEALSLNRICNKLSPIANSNIFGCSFTQS